MSVLHKKHNAPGIKVMGPEVVLKAPKIGLQKYTFRLDSVKIFIT